MDLCVVSLSKALYSNFLIWTQVYKWGPPWADKVAGLFCSRVMVANHLTVTLNIVYSGPIASKQKMGTIGCSEKYPPNFTCPAISTLGMGANFGRNFL